MSDLLLAGDVGGTKTKLGLFELQKNLEMPEVETTLPSAKYPTLEAMVREFLAQNRVRVEYASFGVPGPVIDGHAKITNLPWAVDEKALASRLGIPGAHLMNDLEAMATNVPFLARADLATLNRGRSDPKGNIAVIAPGTGLGETFITREGEGYHVHPSEGGHADFAPTDEAQVELLKYLFTQFEHVSYEEVCSGIGIRNIHAFFEKTSPPEPLSWHARELEAEDPVPLISKAALTKNSECGTCLPTLNTFVSILGAEAGNLALKTLATGGVYIGGGIPREVLPLLRKGHFMESFTKKGRMSELLSRMPVHVILNPRTALLGAARSGIEHMRLNLKVAGEVRA